MCVSCNDELSEVEYGIYVSFRRVQFKLWVSTKTDMILPEVFFVSKARLAVRLFEGTSRKILTAQFVQISVGPRYFLLWSLEAIWRARLLRLRDIIRVREYECEPYPVCAT